MSASNSLHYELCKLGASYVRRRGFQGGQTPNKFAVVELICAGAEDPDIWATNGSSTTLVEVKTSHSDFMADRKKYARSAQAETLGHTVGNYRYYLAPAGVITKDELPEKWGLLEWDGKKIKMVARAKYFKVQSEMELAIFTSIMTRILRPQTFNFRENAEIKFR
jgi:hypothetical protein